MVKSDRGVRAARTRRVGRPRLAPEDVRGTILRIRFSALEWEMIRRQAVELGMTGSAFLRTLGLRGRLPKPAASPATREAMKELSAIGRNLNQAAALARAAGQSEALDEIRAIREVLSRIEERLNP